MDPNRVKFLIFFESLFFLAFLGHLVIVASLPYFFLAISNSDRRSHITKAVQVAWYKTTESAQNTRPQKASKEPFFGLQKIKPFVEHQKNSYVRNLAFSWS